jgi:GntR family transcriptional regulator, transcriptional repressor for pyruvate dehydrogenase complex
MEKKIKTNDSQKDIFVEEIQRLIVTEELSIGEKLLPERQLAEKMKVSRIIVRSGLQELSTKGLVTIIPRLGTYVNNFIIDGNLNTINLLLQYTKKLNKRIAESLLNLRFLLETECVKLAARNRTDEDIKKLGIIILKEELVDRDDFQEQTDIDFEFHHDIAIISKNIMYPAIIKSLENTFKAYVYEYMEKTRTYSDIFNIHRQIYEAIKEKSEEKAMHLMTQMLDSARVLINKDHIYQTK